MFTLEEYDSSSTTDEALCRDGSGGLADLFFSEELEDIVLAKAVCGACAVQARCLEGARARSEPCGVWGGELFVNGKVLANKRKRGRPPKVARTEVGLPNWMARTA